MRCKTLVLCLLFLVNAAHATEGYRLDHACIIFVEPGDSYIGLFGADWSRIYEANRGFVPYDRQSRSAPASERHLFVGSKLVVPAGTYLTQLAMDRVNRYRRIKNEALEPIQEAATFTAKTPAYSSELYGRAVHALAQAKKSADSLTMGFENYVEARILAKEALGLFRMDADLREKDRSIDLLKEQMTKEAREKHQVQEQIGLLLEQLSFLHKQRVIVFEVVIALSVLAISSLLWSVSRKRRRVRAISLQAWLDQHQNHLNSLLSTDV